MTTINPAALTLSPVPGTPDMFYADPVEKGLQDHFHNIIAARIRQAEDESPQPFSPEQRYTRAIGLTLAERTAKNEEHASPDRDEQLKALYALSHFYAKQRDQIWQERFDQKYQELQGETSKRTGGNAMRIGEAGLILSRDFGFTVAKENLRRAQESSSLHFGHKPDPCVAACRLYLAQLTRQKT